MVITFWTFKDTDMRAFPKIANPTPNHVMSSCFEGAGVSQMISSDESDAFNIRIDELKRGWQASGKFAINEIRWTSVTGTTLFFSRCT